MNETTDGDNGALVQSSERQLAANRANAQRSTGPRTITGKAIVALNGVQHGIHAVSPVLPGESPHVWRRFKTAMYLTLTPVGMVEIALAEHITLVAWRMRRVIRFETESIRQDILEADQKWDERFEEELNRAGIEVSGDLVARARFAAQKAVAAQAAFDKFAAGASGAPITNDEALVILSAALAVAGRSRWPEDAWPPDQPGFKAWTVALVRKALESLNWGRRFRNLEQFTRAVGARIARNAQEAASRPREIERRRLKNRRINQLPHSDISERVMRYETHLSRQFHRDLHELERLQAMRLGKPVGHTIAIDVDVSGGTKSD